MLHLLAYPAGILSMLNITQLILSNEDYWCQENFEDNPIQINIILDEYKLLNWSKYSFCISEGNSHGRYNPMDVIRSRDLGHGELYHWLWTDSLDDFVSSLTGRDSCHYFISPPKFGMLLQMNICPNNPRNFSKTLCMFTLILQILIEPPLYTNHCAKFYCFHPKINLADNLITKEK